MSGQRLDKWLWCARLVRTRSGAARLIAAGKVRINGDRALKSSRLVHEGDVVTAMSVGRLCVLRVAATAERRGPASLARGLYEDLRHQRPLPPILIPPKSQATGARVRPSATAAAWTPSVRKLGCADLRDAHAADAVTSAHGSAAGSTLPSRSNSVALSAVTGRLK